ncbi:MAG: hypothetical protein DRJ62_03165 [Thermoprotei archaeon]|nr:MAG: hypothetical protein DRJ62_03165 [Thermoprotei archaeon]
MKPNISPLLWLAKQYLRYNPFFIYGDKNPLLHQTEIVARTLFIKPMRILLADVIGLGKTITALRTLKVLGRYTDIKKVLIVVPSILMEQWKDDMRSMGIDPKLIDREKLDFYRRSGGFQSGWYIGSMDTLKRPEYQNLLLREKWNAIIVDEAHKLGIPGSEPNDRWKNLGRVLIENRDAVLLLLSATPHRGKPKDYLARLALIDPTLLDVTNVGALDKVFDKPEFYRRTHNVILFRRSKDDVNRFYEKREIFKPCLMMAVLTEPNEEEKRFLRIVTELATTYLNSYYARMLSEFGWKTGRAQGIVGLLKTLLIKRGLSSPQSLVKTFSKLVMKRGRFTELMEQGYSFEQVQEKLAEELEEYSKHLDEMLTGDIEDYEKEFDEEFDNLASYFDKFLGEEFKEKLEEARESAERILRGEVEDSKIETLKKILRVVLQESSEQLPNDFKDLPSGKVIIFTEFKDTAYYLYERLRRWTLESFGTEEIVQVFTSDNRGEVEKIKKWLAEDGKKVLITTDVAGEGLNLQAANVLINYEIAWSPIRLEQRIGRIWRYGQQKTTYVFNMFLADALEKTVADIVFSKLYGISVSVGKLEPIIGERILYSTLKNELLEHAIGERTSIGGLMPIEIDFKGNKLTLSEKRIIELITKDAQAFVAAFINGLRKLIREIRYKRIYPIPSTPEVLRKELKLLTGFSETQEVIEFIKELLVAISDLMAYSAKIYRERIVVKDEAGRAYVFNLDNPERVLREILHYFDLEDTAPYYFYRSDEPELMLITEASIIIGGVMRYKEPVGVLARFKSHRVSLSILRGLELLRKLSQDLRQGLPVDEVFGLDDVFSLVSQIVNISHNKYYEEFVKEGAAKIATQLRDYESFKKMLHGLSFFDRNEPEVKIERPKFFLISSALLPETKDKLSDEVWEWTEDEAIPLVFNYEGLCGREAFRVSKFEHYDVRSEKRNPSGVVVERRYIEVKTKTSRSFSVNLKEEEAKIGREKGGEYWLYLVYGVRTNTPVILAIRNPLNRLQFRRYVQKIERGGYVLDV